MNEASYAVVRFECSEPRYPYRGSLLTFDSLFVYLYVTQLMPRL